MVRLLYRYSRHTYPASTTIYSSTKIRTQVLRIIYFEYYGVLRVLEEFIHFTTTGSTVVLRTTPKDSVLRITLTTIGNKMI
jgi:hypothetical protein